MDYKDLPLDQRMELASQYALLLVADNKLSSEIVDIIKSDYALTEEQAVQAVGVMRKVATNKPEQVDSFTKGLYAWTGICGFFLSIFGYQYFFKAGVIDETSITTIHNCIITEPVRREHTSGKNRRYYYVFKFRGTNLEYHFFDNYYKYSNRAFRISERNIWDTVSIQVMNKDLPLLQNKYSTEELDIVNLGLHNRFLIDHPLRNAQIIKSQKNNFYVFFAIFIVLVVTIFLNKGIKDPYRR